MNNLNIIRKLKERFLNNFYPVYHAPLVFDINKQSFYRKSGYVAWPKIQTSESKGKESDGKQKNRSVNSPYFAYPGR